MDKEFDIDIKKIIKVANEYFSKKGRTENHFGTGGIFDGSSHFAETEIEPIEDSLCKAVLQS